MIIRKWHVRKSRVDGLWEATDFSGSARSFGQWGAAFQFAFEAAAWPQIGDCS